MAPSIAASVAGGIAYGLVAAAVSHPFDTIKSQRQAADGLNFNGTFSLPFLYRGVVPATAASVVLRTVPFVGYSTATSVLRSRHLFESMPLVLAFVAGAFGGAMRGCLEAPFELVKTRQQLGATWSPRSLFVGMHSACLRTAAVIGTFWLVFEASAGGRALLPPLLADFVGGGMCSVIAWALIYPLDTAKSRIQGRVEHDGARRGVISELAALRRVHGMAGWYRGIEAGLLRAFLANGSGMLAYGWVCQQMASRAL
jgi:solute carrier family 25 carnitine/acylcarnitine transporter 20/29